MDNIKVALANDDDNSNNELNKIQEVTNDLYSYADTSAVIAAFNANNAMLVSKFYVDGSKIVDTIGAYITGTGLGLNVYGVVLDLAGNIVASSPIDSITSADTAQMIYFNVYDSTKAFTNSYFFAGIAVIGNGQQILGLQAQ